MPDFSFDDLAEQWRQPLINFLSRKFFKSREWAEDIAQEALLRAFVNASKFDATKRWSTWLFSIAINLAKTDLVRPCLLPLDKFYLHDNDVGETSVESKVIFERIQKLIADAPITQQVVLHLYITEQLSEEEIAKKLKMPIFVARNRIRFAQRMILTKYYIDS